MRSMYCVWVHVKLSRAFAECLAHPIATYKLLLVLGSTAPHTWCAYTGFISHGHSKISDGQTNTDGCWKNYDAKIHGGEYKIAFLHSKLVNVFLTHASALYLASDPFCISIPSLILHFVYGPSRSCLFSFYAIPISHLVKIYLSLPFFLLNSDLNFIQIEYTDVYAYWSI